MDFCAEPKSTLVDAHVHFHACFEPRAFLDAAAGNLRAAADDLGTAEPDGVLLFTESRGDSFFRDVRDGARSVPGWTFEVTGEPDSVRARAEDGSGLTLVAGRQVVTRERLEVLALGVDEDFEDGEALEAAIDVVAAAGAFPVVPWGFGKWTGARARVLEPLVEQAGPGQLGLGDNGGRLALAPPPALFARAESRGIPVLPGSDPLPFPGHAARAGSYGFVLPEVFGADSPAAGLKQALRGLRESPKGFGRLENLTRFCRYQGAMQFRRFR